MMPMPPLKIYHYKNCDTCRKALKYLDGKKIKYEAVPIVEQPPTATELKKMLGFVKTRGGSIKNLFNTSGVQYRELGISDKLKGGMTEAEALKLLAGNGKLIKRPFVLIGDRDGGVGFKADEWAALLKA
jgi:arsenate reductase